MQISRHAIVYSVMMVLVPLVVWGQQLEFGNVLGEFKPSVEQFDNGYVDWGNGFYYTVSKGYPPAKRRRRSRRQENKELQQEKAKLAAIEGAKAQILLMASKIRVDAEAYVGDLIAAGYKIKVEGDIAQYEVVAEGWVEDAPRPYYEVVVKAPLNAVSGQLVDSQITKVQTGKRGPVEEPPAAPEPGPEAAQPGRARVPGDADGHGARSAERGARAAGGADRAGKRGGRLLQHGVRPAVQRGRCGDCGGAGWVGRAQASPLSRARHRARARARP